MRIRTLDLFCGAGGSSWGALKAGAQIVLGVDGWNQAIETYDVNFRKKGKEFMMEAGTAPSDIEELQGKKIDLLLASPECTNHTCAKGAAERSEESKKTANYVLRFAADLQPRWIVIENVIHMRSWKGYKPLLDGLKDLGYNIREEIVNSVDFGVPQTRKRLFILCDRERHPAPLPRKHQEPKPASDIFDFDPFCEEDSLKSRPIADRAKPTIERFKRGMKVLGKGNPFLVVYYGTDGAGGWQPLDRPLRTITTIDRFGLVTWKGGIPHLRMLQVPELMRAMGFKDEDAFLLTGSRREKIKQLGNGVCPPVMEAIIRHLTMKSKPINGRASSSVSGKIAAKARPSKKRKNTGKANRLCGVLA